MEDRLMHPDSRPELYDYLLDRTMLVETKETRKVGGCERASCRSLP